jgi:L-threonylcarbamoyladenylate synthase
LIIKKVIRVDAGAPDPGAIAKAAEIIRAGGVVIFPTTGLYGLGADAGRAEAVSRLFTLKGRPESKPILVLIPHRRALGSLVRTVPDAAVALMDRFWPGGLTLVLPARPDVRSPLTAGTGGIGVRLPAHPVASALVSAVGGPITGTSANRSGEPGCASVADLPADLIDGVDLVLDAGPLRGGPGSTIVDLTVDPPAVRRAGAVPTAVIRKALGGRKPVDIHV